MVSLLLDHSDADISNPYHAHIALVASFARQLLWSNLMLVLLRWEQREFL